MLKLSRALVHLEEMGQQEGNDSQLAFLGRASRIAQRLYLIHSSSSVAANVKPGLVCLSDSIYHYASCHSTTFRSRDWPKRMLGQDTDL
jgi:hypothetical protein